VPRSNSSNRGRGHFGVRRDENIPVPVCFAAVLAAILIGGFVAAAAAQPAVYPDAAKVRQDFARLLDRPKVALAPQFTKTTEGASAIERGTFAAEAGKRVPTLIVRSANATGRLPVAIMLHGTGSTKESVRDWLDGFAGRGYLAVGLDARYHGEWIPGGAQGAKEYNEAAIAEWKKKPGEKREYPFWWDSTWDVIRAVDYLVTRPDVDPARIAVLGISMGGIQAYYAAAIDDRIKAVVPLIAAQSMRWSLENNQWQGRANTIATAHKVAAADLGEADVNQRVARALWTKLLPGVLDEFDVPSILRLVAPRPMLLLSTELDQNCPLPGAKLAFAEAEAAYRKAGASDKLTIDVAPNARHQVVPAHRQLANEWLDRQFNPKAPGATQ
jgi:dienelactone hydrolase